MLKNIFKSAKKLLKNPVVQLGIGALLPGMLPASMGILRNPAILQAGIGALAEISQQTLHVMLAYKPY